MKMRMIFIVGRGRDRLQQESCWSRALAAPSLLVAVLAFALPGCGLQGQSAACGGAGGNAGAGGSDGRPAAAWPKTARSRFRAPSCWPRSGPAPRTGARLSREGGRAGCRRVAPRGDARRRRPATAAREAFRQAMDSWQVMDIDAVRADRVRRDVPGGKDFRGQHLRLADVRPLRDRGGTSSRAPTSRRLRDVCCPTGAGLGALEYLLFYEGDRHRVHAAARPARLERPDRRRSATRASAPTPARRGPTCWRARRRSTRPGIPAADELRPDDAIGRPGNPSIRPRRTRIHPSASRSSIVDRMVKDQKLASRSTDMTLHRRAPVRSCFESPYAGRSKANIRANLDGAPPDHRRVRAPTTPDSASTICCSVGAATLADTLRPQAIAAEAALDAIDEPDLDQALTPGPGVGRRAARRDRRDHDHPQDRASYTTARTSSIPPTTVVD